MSLIPDDAFKSPVIGTDPVTKGTFTIQHADILFDFDEDFERQNTRATGSILIEGYGNPLFEAIKEHPLRAQELVASVIFGVEKRFIRFEQMSNFNIIDDGIVQEIDFSLTFEILDNLLYLEKVIEYRDNHNL